MQIRLSSKYTDLIAGIIALLGAVVIFLFFINVNINPLSSGKRYIIIKPGYASWAWGIYSICSILYYFFRSKGKKISGGYINPIFKWTLETMRIIPIIGLLFSLINSFKFIIESHIWNSVVVTSSNFLDSIFILFVFTLFGTGIGSIRGFFKNNYD